MLKSKKFSVYKAEIDELEHAREFLPPGFPDDVQTLESSIMDIADDITYAVHDLEDFYHANLLDMSQIEGHLKYARQKSDPSGQSPFERLWRDLDSGYPGYFDETLYKSALEEVSATLQRGFPTERGRSSSDNNGLPATSARDHCSALINRYVNSVEIRKERFWATGPFIALQSEKWHEIQVLKQITRGYIIERSDVAMMQRGQQNLLRKLVLLLHEWSIQDRDRLPFTLRQEMALAESQMARGRGAQRKPWRGAPERCILDYLCSLGDEQCNHLHRVLTGSHSPAIALAFNS
ncbi:hypothetical protein [Actinoplanes sp. NPDC089786]|uniref:hypothetical protein n=1 Tax=Actinoplanes sp. NPDC089786 TaxID=3155185 RepID=UPI003430D7AE